LISVDMPKARFWELRPSAIEWIYLLGGLFLVFQYRWFLDDSFIYFRYVDNLLFLDLGLVYNDGEYVEGYSSPLWALLLVGLRSLELEYSTIIHLVAVLSFLSFGCALIALDRRLAPPGPRINLPLAYLGFNYAVLSYFTSGTEAPLVQMSAPLYGLFIVSPASRILQGVLGLTPLVRHELLIPVLICIAWGFYKRTQPWTLVVTAASALGAWGGFRIYYYADLLPNTFYLKDASDYGQGLLYLHDTLGPYSGYLIAVLALAAIAALARQRTQLHLAERGVMLLVAASVLLFVVKIGGDSRHYRYLAFPFCLGIASLSGLGEQVWAKYVPSRVLVWAPAAGVIVACLSFWFYPRQLDRHPAFFETNHSVVDKISDAELHRNRVFFRLPQRSPFVSIEALRQYRTEHEDRGYGKVLASFDCAASYSRFGMQIVNSLGLTDAILARTRMPVRKPGHKWGLQELASDLARIRSTHPPGRGMYRAAIAKGEAPPWIVNNLPAIEVIERKIYNRHDLVENVRLAVAFPDRIEP
jgi:hypothetical protein